eukprot:316603-Prorocentrum_minimum.AAC.2
MVTHERTRAKAGEAVKAATAEATAAFFSEEALHTTAVLRTAKGGCARLVHTGRNQSGLCYRRMAESRDRGGSSDDQGKHLNKTLTDYF